MFLMVLGIDMAYSQSKAEREVKALLEQQRNDWNRGDVEGFMQGYHQSEELQFISPKGVTFGWQNTLSNYKKAYPDKEAMGHLDFELIRVIRQSKKVVSVTGKYILTRSSGEVLDGHFLLLVKKMDGRWQIIADYSG